MASIVMVFSLMIYILRIYIYTLWYIFRNYLQFLFLVKNSMIFVLLCSLSVSSRSYGTNKLFRISKYTGYCWTCVLAVIDSVWYLLHIWTENLCRVEKRMSADNLALVMARLVKCWVMYYFSTIFIFSRYIRMMDRDTNNFAISRTKNVWWKI